MAHYLVVAHQTAVSPELVDLLKGKAAEDPDVAFTLLVPATPINHLWVWSEGETQEVAAKRAIEALAGLRKEGIPVTRSKVGVASPIAAVSDELRLNPGTYTGVIVSTFPAGLSHWLGLGVVDRIRRLTELPVIHVTADAALGDENPSKDGEPDTHLVNSAATRRD